MFAGLRPTSVMIARRTMPQPSAAPPFRSFCLDQPPLPHTVQGRITRRATAGAKEPQA